MGKLAENIAWRVRQRKGVNRGEFHLGSIEWDGRLVASCACGKRAMSAVNRPCDLGRFEIRGADCVACNDGLVILSGGGRCGQDRGYHLFMRASSADIRRRREIAATGGRLALAASRVVNERLRDGADALAVLEALGAALSAWDMVVRLLYAVGDGVSGGLALASRRVNAYREGLGLVRMGLERRGEAA